VNRVLPYLKSIAALVGSIATALLAIYAGNEVLVILAVICTAVGTWAIPNSKPGDLPPT
jgi:hypothetical protein